MARVKWIARNTSMGVEDKGSAALMSSGEGPGVSPMQMLLLGLGGCSMVDILLILQKQRQRIVDLEVEVRGVRGQELPRPWETINLHYIVVGEELDDDKVARAISLSLEKYCGVHGTLAGVAQIRHDYEIRAAAGVPVAAG